MHLQTAELVKARLASRPDQSAALLTVLNDEWPAFYFGSAAPDFQSICGIPREDTHFYRMPPDPDNMAYTRMFASYPELADAGHLPAAKMVFLAGYIAHLLLDLVWFRQILVPMFFRAEQLGSRQQRHLLHLILLAYLDRVALKALPDSAAVTMASAQPVQWLPFGGDEELRQWRDYLVPQLKPGAVTQTTEIYAARLGVTEEAFAGKLKDGAWLQSHLFSQVPVPRVQQILRDAVPPTIQLIEDYCAGRLM